MRGHDRYVERNGRRRGGVTALVDFLVVVVTVVFALLLVSAYLAKYVDPKDAWFFAFAGLGAPIFFIANLLLLLFWVVRWRMYMLVPLITILIGAGNISLFFRPGSNGKPETARQSPVKLMTYNVMGFMEEGEGGKLVSDLDETAEIINEIRPDILCIQEYQAIRSNPKSRIDSLLGMRYSEVHFKLPNSSGEGWGLAVYSRYPIVGSGVIDYPDSRNSSMWADVKIGRDTVRVFNNHLQTTSVSRGDREYIDTQEFLTDSEGREEKVRSIAGKLRGGFVVRAQQADSLSAVIAASPYDVIVCCGDFNDTPMSYTYHTIRGDLRDAFVEKGAGMPSTFKGLFNMFRIDYVLYSPELRVLGYDSPDAGYSDHNPVVVQFDMVAPARRN